MGEASNAIRGEVCKQAVSVSDHLHHGGSKLYIAVCRASGTSGSDLAPMTREVLSTDIAESKTMVLG